MSAACLSTQLDEPGVTILLSFNELFAGVWQSHRGAHRVLTVRAGWRQSRFLQRRGPVRMSEAVLDLPIAPIRFIYFQS